MLRLVLRSGSTTLGRLSRRWSAFTDRHEWAQRWISRPTLALSCILRLRWPAGLRVNPLFDEGWYREQYPDAPPGRLAAYRHYLRTSRTRAHDPNPDFDTDWYLQQNPDMEVLVRIAHWTGHVYWRQHHFQEGR